MVEFKRHIDMVLRDEDENPFTYNPSINSLVTRKVEYIRHIGRRFVVELEKIDYLLGYIEPWQTILVRTPNTINNPQGEILVMFPAGALDFHWFGDPDIFELLQSRRGVDRCADRILEIAKDITDEDIGCALFGPSYNSPDL